MRALNVFFAVFWMAHVPIMIFTDYTPNGFVIGCACFLAGLGSLMTRGDSQ